MKITFLGTCACDFSPRLKTDLKDKFDKDARRSSALLIGESTLVDCGVHILDELRISGTDPGKIKDILVTHLHIDHYDVDNVKAIAEAAERPLRLWVKEGANVPEISGVEVIHMTQFERYELAPDLYVTGMPANHAYEVFPQHFLIETEGKSMFYGCDGAWLLNETCRHLMNRALDLIILDCTVGDYAGDKRLPEHNSIPMIRLMLPSFKTLGISGDKTRVYLSHLAPSLNAPHDETVKIAAEIGCLVAYDGLSIDL